MILYNERNLPPKPQVEVPLCKNALVAQLAEHIHGKDKVISSILIEG